MQGEMVAVLICLGRRSQYLLQPVRSIWAYMQSVVRFGLDERLGRLQFKPGLPVGKRAKRLQPSKSVLYYLAHLLPRIHVLESLARVHAHNRPSIASATFFVLSLRS